MVGFGFPCLHINLQSALLDTSPWAATLIQYDINWTEQRLHSFQVPTQSLVRCLTSFTELQLHNSLSLSLSLIKLKLTGWRERWLCTESYQKFFNGLLQLPASTEQHVTSFIPQHVTSTGMDQTPISSVILYSPLVRKLYRKTCVCTGSSLWVVWHRFR